MKAGLPRKRAEIPAWAERLRAERVNDTGRAVIDILERVVEKLLTAKAEHVASIAKAVDALMRAALQADRASEALGIAELRKRADRLEKVSSRIRGMH